MLNRVLGDESFSILAAVKVSLLPSRGPPPLILVPQTAAQAYGRDRSIRSRTRSGPRDHAQFWFSPVLLATVVYSLHSVSCRSVQLSGVWAQPIGPAGVRQPVGDIIGGDGPGPDQNRPALTLTSTSPLSL